MKRFLYLPSDYKHRRHKKVEGRASTGEISDKGLVTHIEDWDGRVAVEAEPAAMHYAWSISEQRLRPLTREEMIAKGYLIPGKGPKGME